MKNPNVDAFEMLFTDRIKQPKDIIHRLRKKNSFVFFAFVYINDFNCFQRWPKGGFVNKEERYLNVDLQFDK